MNTLLETLLPVCWALLWVAGGWLLTAALFRLRRGEMAMVGLSVGLVLQIWLSNIVAHAFPAPLAFWLSAGIVLLAGVAAAVRFRPSLDLKASTFQWICLGGLTLLFVSIGRGLGIFDDYQNLPTISLMAAGDVPPHFALNPSLNFGYHYLLLLFAAQAMRLGHMFPWSALDLARGLFLSLPLVLGGLWGYRLRRTRLAAFLTACILAFAGGSRWLLLLLPPSWLETISGRVKLIGSAASSAPNLAEAMISNWKIDGAGPIPFPFAFYSGVNQPYIMGYTGIAGSAILIMLVILLTAQRWRHWSAALVTTALLASLSIANEIAFLLLGLGLGISILVWFAMGRRWGASRGVMLWGAMLGGALAISSQQGGMLTEIAASVLRPHAGSGTYFDAAPVFVWPPAIVSAHLGSLSLFEPLQLFLALLEVGPVVIVTPLILAWGWKSLRVGKWFEAALVGACFGALLAALIAFKGPLFTATPRLMGGWFFASALYAVPLLWAWLQRRPDGWRAAVVGVGLMSVLGGLVLFGVQLAAIQKPIYATFITPMDAKMSQEYWNQLDPGSLVFDPVVFRAPTVLGRFTNSSPTWYTRSAEWQALNDAPDPVRLRAAGFEYAYFDSDYWESLTPADRSAFAAPCVKQLAQIDGIHSEQDYTKDFRRLLDIRSCE